METHTWAVRVLGTWATALSIPELEMYSNIYLKKKPLQKYDMHTFGSMIVKPSQCSAFITLSSSMFNGLLAIQTATIESYWQSDPVVRIT